MSDSLPILNNGGGSQCLEAEKLDFDFTMAFQPIVDCQAHTIFGYEALVRGLNNESAYSVIKQVNDENRYNFDQQCRIKAIALAASLNWILCSVSIFYPMLYISRSAVLKPP